MLPVCSALATALLSSFSTMRDRYVDALCRQVPLLLSRIGKQGSRVSQIFWGGGTPSLLSPAEMGRVLAALGEHLDLSTLGQHTLEVLPRTVEEDDPRSWRDLGIDRLCLGLQSLVDDRLRAIGSAHRHADVKRVYRWVEAAGFDNVCLDLMFGFPGETVSEAETSIARYLELRPAAIQLYHFSPRKGLPLRDLCDAGKLPYPRFDVTINVLAALEEQLSAAGYERWLPTFWALEPRYRSGYMDHKFSLRSEVIGFGAGAHSVVGQKCYEYPAPRLDDFLSDPVAALSVTPASTEQTLVNGFSSAISHPEGLRYSHWRRMYGEDLAMSARRVPVIRSVLDFFAQSGVLREVHGGLKLVRGRRTAQALVELSYRFHLPGQLRRRPMRS